MKLTTKRLILRDPTLKDAKDIARNIGNIKVSENLAAVPYPYTLKDAKWYFNKCSKNMKEKPRKEYVLVIEFKAKKRVMGGKGK